MTAIEQLSRALATGALATGALASIDHEARAQAVVCFHDRGFRAWVERAESPAAYGRDLARFRRCVATLPAEARAWGAEVFGAAFAARWRELVANDLGKHSTKEGNGT